MDRILSKMNNPNQPSPITVSTNIKSKLTKYFQFSIIQQDISPNEVEMCDYDYCKLCLVIKGFQSQTKILRSKVSKIAMFKTHAKNCCDMTML